MIKFKTIRVADPYSFQSQVESALNDGFSIRELHTVSTDTHVFHIAYMTTDAQ